MTDRIGIRIDVLAGSAGAERPKATSSAAMQRVQQRRHQQDHHCPGQPEPRRSGLTLDSIHGRLGRRKLHASER